MRNSFRRQIKTLKMYFMSRSIKKQGLAINKLMEIVKSCNDEDMIKFLIGADIPGLLCDIMNNHDPKLIVKVFSCLLELSNHEEFYRQKNSTIVVETTCRTIMILTSEGKHLSSIVKGLELLRKILSGRGNDMTVNLHHVIEVLSVILGSHIFHAMHLNAMSVLKIILLFKDFDHQNLPDLIYTALILIHKLRRNNAHRFNKYINTPLSIITSSLRYYSSHEDSPKAQRASNVVWSLVVSSVIPFLKEIYAKKYDEHVVLNQLNCLLAAYDCLDKSKKITLSNLLATNGYLSLLPEFNLLTQRKSVHKSVINLLYHILAWLALVELQLPMRIGGLIRKALQKLPADSTKWPELLAETNHSPYIHLTIIIHLNFVLLRDCGDSMIKSSHLPALCKYILSKNSLPSPPELKAIAFVFAVLHLSHAQSVGNSRREIAQATQRIIQWLKCTEMSDVFTHHPALLYWIFNINDKPLQMSVIALWMRDKSPASQKELEDLVLKVDEAALLLVDILSCCSRKMLNEVMSPIKTILDRNSDQKIIISKHIWSKLPSIISRLTSPEITSKRLMNVSVVIYIACRTVPRIPDTRLMLRLSQQLVQAFQRFCGSTWEHTEINTQNLDTQLLLAQMLKLAHVIAFKMIHISEYRESGLKIFLEEDSVLRALLACMKSDCKIVTHPALKLLAYLLHSQNVYNIQIRSNGYVIGADFLQVLVEKCNIDTTFYAADLFNSLQVENTKMLISLSSNMRISVIHSLYHAFLKISRRPGEATGLCWRCGSLLLKYCRLYDQDVVIGLLYHPEYKKGLELAFKKGGIRDNYFAEYALEYFKAGRKYLSYYNDDLACTQNPVSTNLIRVAQQLLTRDWPSGSHQSSLLQEICSMDRKIPSNVINALKLKRSRLYSRVLSENSDTD